MDALTFLRQDHKSVLGMLEVLADAPAGTGAKSSGLSTMVTNLVIAESQHEAIEEQIFWPAVREAREEGDALADKAIEQEQAGKNSCSDSKTATPVSRGTRRRYSSSSKPDVTTSTMSRTWCGPFSKRQSAKKSW
jgi:hypothetical protein